MTVRGVTMEGEVVSVLVVHLFFSDLEGLMLCLSVSTLTSLDGL